MEQCILYHNPGCSKSQGAYKWLTDNQIEFEMVEYMSQPMGIDALDAICKKLGKAPKELIRGSPLATTLKLEEKNNEDESYWLQLIVDNPLLMERPICVYGDKAAIGRPLSNIKKLFKPKASGKPLELEPGNKVSKPHNNLFELMCGDIRVATDIIKNSVSKKLFKQIDLQSLRPTDKSFISAKLRHIQSDMVYEAQINGKEAYVAFILEHQSSSNEMMAFRKLEYNVGLMGQHVRRDNKKLPLIINICIYHGTESPYPYSTSIYDCFNDPKLAKEHMFKDFKLIDLTIMNDNEIEKQGYAALMEFLFAHCRDAEFSRTAKQLAGFLRLLDAKMYIEPVLEYISSACGDQDDVEKLLTSLVEALPEEKEKIMTYGQQLESRGEVRGMQQGMQQGIEQGYQSAMQHIAIKKQEAASQAAKQAAHERDIEIAKKMLMRDTTFEVIAEDTGLSIAEIKKLKRAIIH